MKPEDVKMKYRDILIFPQTDKQVPLSRYYTVADFEEPGNEFIYVSQKLLKILNKLSQRFGMLVSSLTVKHHGTEVSFNGYPSLDIVEYLKQFDVSVILEEDRDWITIIYKE